jgi:chorismate-pyruvate lyase
MHGFHLEVLKTNPFRDVVIYNGNHKFMYARTIAPKMTQNALKGVYDFEKPSPIGDFLFHSPNVKRGEVNLQLFLYAPNWLSDYEKQARLYCIRQTHWYYQKVYLIHLIEVFI